ncbi:hypothetical protein [Streptomyces sp. NPDC050856]|uniref:hypothetical protein n=1 Tax=Streptomyces sp. NPDC050856 TaxID=3154939 RepID=UPI0033F25945
MRRAGFVVAAATTLMLGAGGPGWTSPTAAATGTSTPDPAPRATSTSTAVVSSSWGDRVRIEMSWTERHTIGGATLTVSDRTCDDRPVRVTLTVATGDGGTASLGDRHNTGGCGTDAHFRDINAVHPDGVRRLTMAICRQVPGEADHCETRYTAVSGANRP